jgi:drug/metabolite transporter (DMT)-like permease
VAALIFALAALMPYLIFLFICAVWSVSFLLMKKAVVAFSPVEIGAWRVAGGAAMLGAVWWWQGRGWTLGRRHAWPLLFVVMTGFAWPFCAQPWVIARHGSALMALVVAFTPLLTVLMSLGVLGASPSRRQGIGVAGALLCLSLLFVDGLKRDVPAADLALAVTVPLSYAAANVVLRRWLSDVSSLLVTLVALVLASVALFPVTGIEGRPSASREAVFVAVASLALLGPVGTGLASYLFNKLIRDHGPLFASMTTNVVPLGAVFFGWLDGEIVTPLQLAAMGGVLSMVTLVQFGAAKKQGPAFGGQGPGSA